MLTFGELFAGISGFGLGFEQVGMKCLWQVELDRDCNKVLEARYPNVERIRNVKDAGKHNLRPVDVIAFGWPCQDLSVAGLRAGISGKRSGLFHEAARVIQELRPKWIVAENVPGLFSSYTPVDAPPSDVAIGTEWEVEEDSDFERVLATLDELGYCVSWRVCDAQFWNVAQRRERVFIVGSLGNLGSCEVFPFAESLPGDFETRREAGPGVTPILEAGARTNGDGNRDGDGIGVEGDPMHTLQSGKQHGIAGPLAAHSKAHGHAMTTQQAAESNHLVSMPLKAKANSSHDESHEIYVTHALRSEGADASEDGTGRGTPLIAAPLTANYGKQLDNSDRNGGPPNIIVDDLEHHRFHCLTCGQWFGVNDYESNTVTCPNCGETHIDKITDVLDARAVDVRNLRMQPDGTSGTLQGKKSGGYPLNYQNPVMTFGWNKSDSQTMRVDEETTEALQSAPCSQPAIAFSAGQGSKARSLAESTEHSPPLKAANSGLNQVPAVQNGFGVRRLTPRECERLQGFPDDWTLYDASGKEISDSARYRMLGNAVAVPVARFIGSRIRLSFDQQLRQPTGQRLDIKRK